MARPILDDNAVRVGKSGVRNRRDAIRRRGQRSRIKIPLRDGGGSATIINAAYAYFVVLETLGPRCSSD